MENLKIRQKTEDMIEYGYQALSQFPKSEKFSLAQDIKRSMLSLLEQIIRTNRSHSKQAMLYNIDTELEVLRSQIRLAMRLKHLPFGKYEVWGKQLAEIGRMLGGWINSMKKG